jgi:hypothetical protein
MRTRIKCTVLSIFFLAVFADANIAKNVDTLNDFPQFKVEPASTITGFPLKKVEAVNILPNFPQLQQFNGYTCYAYAARAILVYYKKDTSIKAIIDYAAGGDTLIGRPLQSPIKPVVNYCVEGILLNFGGITCSQEGILSFEQIKTNYNDHKPIPVFLQWLNNSYGHIVDICGYGDDNSVYFMDPEKGIIKNMSYDEFRNYNGSNPNFQWTESLWLLSSPPQ